MNPEIRETEGPGEMTPVRRRELLDELKGLVARAHDGEKEALSRVGEILEEVPTLARSLVDFAGEAERSLIKRVSGDDPLLKKALPPQLEAMRKEVAGPAPSPLERLLSERIVACWLQLQYADVLYAQNLGEMTMEQNEYHQRRLDRLHKRYLSAVKTLAQIRKLGPAVQINIADKQINTTAS